MLVQVNFHIKLETKITTKNKSAGRKTNKPKLKRLYGK